MKLFMEFWAWLFEDKRSAWEQKQDRKAIEALNKLKNYSVSDRGGLSTDPDELRELVMAERKKLKHLVQSSLNRTTQTHQSITAPLTTHQGDQEPSASGLNEFVEVVTWRRLNSEATVRYVCLQSTSTGRYAVATANLFSGGTESLPPWVDANINRQVASALQNAELSWYKAVSEAMDAWDAEL